MVNIQGSPSSLTFPHVSLPNLIVTNSYLSQLLTDRREELWTAFTNAGLELFQSLSIIEAAISSPQGSVFIFYQGKNYKLDMDDIIRI